MRRDGEAAASSSRISATTRARLAPGRDACGYVDKHGWTCGNTMAERTDISGDESTPPMGGPGWAARRLDGLPVQVPAG
jgi:hypothetical protein